MRARCLFAGGKVADAPAQPGMRLNVGVGVSAERAGRADDERDDAAGQWLGYGWQVSLVEHTVHGNGTS